MVISILLNHPSARGTRRFYRYWRGSYWLGKLLFFMVAMGTTVFPPTQAIAQMLPLPSPSNIPTLPAGVEQRGSLESVAITLDGQDLFRIASPAVVNRNEPGNQVPVEVRARQIEGNLQRLLPGSGSSTPPADAETLEVIVNTINGFPVLFAQDATQIQPRALLTVTDVDAQYYAIGKAELAAQWQIILEQELRQAIAMRQPEAIRQQLATAIKILIGMVGATLLLGLLWALLGRRERYLRQREEAEAALINVQEDNPTIAAKYNPGKKQQALLLLRQYLSLQGRLQFVRFLRWLLFWLIAFIWAFGTAYSLNIFPQTRQFARTLVIAPIVLLLAWFLMGLVNRLIDFGVEKIVQNLAQAQSPTATNLHNLQRITTIARVLKGLKMVLVYTIGVLWVLQWLQLVPGSVLALGTVVALVISFASQNLVRDLVNGFFILLEDQYRIGDVVMLGDKSGLVENLNLRITQLRNPDGHLITVPNSAIVEVENLSRDWSRSDFRIEVAYDTDVDLALAIVRDTADKMTQDPQWKSTILDTHEFFGVEHLSHSGIVIRIWMKTAPMQQWVVAMELRRRLKKAFDRHGIQIGTPQQLWLQNGVAPDPVPESDQEYSENI
jgi:small-conductance mechanosensitive channel